MYGMPYILYRNLINFKFNPKKILVFVILQHLETKPEQPPPYGVNTGKTSAQDIFTINSILVRGNTPNETSCHRS